MPIHYAANEGHLEAVKTLVNVCHCDAEVKDVVSCGRYQSNRMYCTYIGIHLHTCGGGGHWQVHIVALQ